MCREMISDYAPGARVMVPEGSDSEVVPISSLLPNKYVRP
jgi:cytidine deaminase